jgi:hypothetical protein
MDLFAAQNVVTAVLQQAHLAVRASFTQVQRRAVFESSVFQGINGAKRVLPEVTADLSKADFRGDLLFDGEMKTAIMRLDSMTEKQVNRQTVATTHSRPRSQAGDRTGVAIKYATAFRGTPEKAVSPFYRGKHPSVNFNKVRGNSSARRTGNLRKGGSKSLATHSKKVVLPDVHYVNNVFCVPPSVLCEPIDVVFSLNASSGSREPPCACASRDCFEFKPKHSKVLSGSFAPCCRSETGKFSNECMQCEGQDRDGFVVVENRELSRFSTMRRTPSVSEWRNRFQVQARTDRRTPPTASSTNRSQSKQGSHSTPPGVLSTVCVRPWAANIERRAPSAGRRGTPGKRCTPSKAEGSSTQGNRSDSFRSSQHTE